MIYNTYIYIILIYIYIYIIERGELHVKVAKASIKEMIKFVAKFASGVKGFLPS